MTELALNQLNIAFLAVPPLVVLVLADLLVTQRRTPWRNGLALAGLVVVQFFVSTEVLLITALAVAGRRGRSWSPGPRVAAARRAGGPRASGPVTGARRRPSAPSAVVLAYPLWFLLAGPAHLVGPIWSSGATSRFGTTPASFVTTGGLGDLRPSMLRFGGYQGPVLVGLGYLGLGVLAVGRGRDGGVAARPSAAPVRCGRPGGGRAVARARATASGSRGTALQHVPWIGDIVEVRFVLVVTLCVAVMAALAVDHAHTALVVQADSRAPRSGRASGWLTGGLVALVLVPTVVALCAEPAAHHPGRGAAHAGTPTRGRSRRPGRVVLAYPVPSSGLQSSEAWQAVNAMAWAQASGGGPQGQPFRAGAARPGFEVLSAASLPLGPAPDRRRPPTWPPCATPSACGR